MTWWHYLLLVNFYLVLFFGFYALLLRRETFFQLNRIYLVAAALLSFIIPVIQADWVQNLFITQEVQQTIYSMPLTIPYFVTTAQDTGITMGQVVTFIYISVALVLIGRLMWQLLILKKAIEKPTPSAAYTFFKKISLGENVAQSKIINDHEQVHAGQWHSVDVMIIETVMIINWFNPVVYLYRFAIKYIHEFIADSHVIQAGTDKADYALLLLSQTFDVSSNNLVNQFYNHSLLKQRIMMMQKNKSHRIALAKYGLSAPLFILMMIFSSATVNNSKAVAAITDKTETAFATPATEVIESINDNARIPDEIPAEETKALVENPFGLYDVQPIETYTESTTTMLAADTDKVFNKVDKQPEFPGGLQSFGKFLGDNIKYPKEDREKGTTGKVFVTFVVETDGTLSDIKVVRTPSQTMAAEAIRVMSKSPKWTPGSNAGQAVRVAYVTPISFSLEDVKPTGATVPAGLYQTSEVVIRGYTKRTEGADKDGPIFSDVEKQPQYTGGLEGFGKFLSENVRYPKADRENGISGKVIVTFIVEKDGSLNDIRAIRGPSQAMMDEAVLALTKSPKWQPGYQNGLPVRVSYTVPVAFTLEGNKDDTKPQTSGSINLRGFSTKTNQPLYVVDGKVSEMKTIEGIAPETIASINVLKGETATNSYGTRAKNGAVLITTKGYKATAANKLATTTIGTVAGLSINKTATTSTAKPGSLSQASAEVLIRTATGKTVPTEPLYVIDGKKVNIEVKDGKRVSPLVQINQDDILSMEILKDETATKLYGSAGANGVIIVTTKNAKKAK